MSERFCILFFFNWILYPFYDAIISISIFSSFTLIEYCTLVLSDCEC